MHVMYHNCHNYDDTRVHEDSETWSCYNFYYTSKLNICVTLHSLLVAKKAVVSFITMLNMHTLYYTILLLILVSICHAP